LLVTALEKSLIAIDPSGNVLWQKPLEEVPVGTPALDRDGQIYVADNKGGVTKLDPQGTVIWRAQVSNGRNATSGPVLDEAGNIYLTIVDAVVALSPQGELRWRTVAADVYLEEAPRLGSDQSMVFLKNTAIDAGSGDPLPLTIGSPQDLFFNDPTYFTGADGNDYYRLGHEIIGWRLTDGGLEIDEGVTWPYNTLVLFTPYEQGVTPSRLYWMYYASSYADGRMIWLDDQSRMVGNYRFTFSNSKLIAIGEKDEAYICSSTGARLVCIDIAPGANEPTWTAYVDDAPAAVLGGVFVPGRIYISLDNDGIYAIGANEAGAP
jgi:hypothetical protein